MPVVTACFWLLAPARAGIRFMGGDVLVWTHGACIQAVDFELRGTGVRVCTLCPGPVATLFGGKAGNDRTVLFKLLPVATAKSTATYGWDGMLRGQRTMVHGWLNWMLALFGGITPTWLMLPMSRMMLRPV